ncbi:hypothetical protein V6N11_070409 [Hibiscus sabdariffa]|uniref:DUF4216 domain-containing protein n=1 Tax=Hibiscus sabdariffa TaxID=183260 RepID=A0ABR2QEX3_9ROSI
MEESEAFTLQHGGKQSWFDNHRKILPHNHHFRRNTTAFRKGKKVLNNPPPIKSGREILNEIDYWGFLKVTEPDAVEINGQDDWERDERYLSDEEIVAAHTYILLNCTEVEPFIEMYRTYQRYCQPHLSDTQIDATLDNEFSKWFNRFVQEPTNNITNIFLKALAMGPLRLVKSFSGYKVNGFKFRTMAYGSDKPSPNCGVCVKGSNYVNGESDYFGRLVEVIQIQYPGWPVKSIVLFKCEWFDPRPGVGTKINPKYPSLVEVNEKKRYSGNDIFVLATQATQVYYVNYPSLRRDKQDWLVVIKIKARAIVDIPVSNNVEPLLAHRFLKTCTDAGNVEAYYTLGMGGWVPTQGKPEIFSSMDEKKAWLMEHQYGEMNPNDKFHCLQDGNENFS